MESETGETNPWDTRVASSAEKSPLQILPLEQRTIRWDNKHHRVEKSKRHLPIVGLAGTCHSTTASIPTMPQSANIQGAYSAFDEQSFVGCIDIFLREIKDAWQPGRQGDCFVLRKIYKLCLSSKWPRPLPLKTEASV